MRVIRKTTQTEQTNKQRKKETNKQTKTKTNQQTKPNNKQNTNQPTTKKPTNRPTHPPTNQPTNKPTNKPTNQPTKQPSKQPSNQATKQANKQASNNEPRDQNEVVSPGLQSRGCFHPRVSPSTGVPLHQGIGEISGNEADAGVEDIDDQKDKDLRHGDFGVPTTSETYWVVFFQGCARPSMGLACDPNVLTPVINHPN